MSKVPTDRSSNLPSPDPASFRGHMGVTATRLVDRALDQSKCSERSVAAGFGYSTENLRHLRDTEQKKHIQFRDILCLKDIAPDAYRFILNEMAERAGLAVVERVDSSKSANLLQQLAVALKEDGEANAALLAKVGTSCPETRRAAIREGREALSARQSLLRALEEEEAEHRAAIAPRAYAGAS